MRHSAIFGMSGPRLTPDEVAFFRDIKPYGFILFARNCTAPDQIRALISELKNLMGEERLPILIDQEGGRVARLKPPYWPAYPPAGKFAGLFAINKESACEATYLNARLIARDLFDLGITVDCAPLADLPVAGAHDIIGDRAFGRSADQVIQLARAFARGLVEGGIVPVLKHIPGHGRAGADSHEELPVVRESLEVLRATDFVPFKALSDLPMAMTAHVLYTAIDNTHMATVSPTIIRLIREELGFDGLLMSDDVSMKAMQGDFTQRTHDTLVAGCDVVLHCNGDMKEMQAVAKALIPLEGRARERALRAMKLDTTIRSIDVAEARTQLDKLLSVA